MKSKTQNKDMQGLNHKISNFNSISFLKEFGVLLFFLLVLTYGVDAQTTYYAYQSGDWASVSTWTTDPSGSISVNPSVPGISDRVVILNGRTVYTTNAKIIASTQINEGGTIDLRNTTGHDLGIVSGQGLIKLQSNTFPGGSFTAFVSAGGGTVEYYNETDYTFNQLTYNNLIINHSTAGIIATLAGNMIINGNFTISSGRFQINDATSNSRTCSISGNVTIGVNGSIRLGTGDANHRFLVNGNFSNYGSVRFTNQVSPQYTNTPTDGRADVVFSNPVADQNLECNGLSDFYRIEIDKGTDQTYILNIDASNSANFALYGRNDRQPAIPAQTPPNLPNDNALGLLAGTVRLGSNISIPCLGTDSGGNGVFSIDEDARLWLDGATVIWNPTPQSYVPVVYGGFKLSAMSYFDIRNGENGLVIRTTAIIDIEGGQLDVPVIRVSSQDGLGAHRGAYNQSGGTVNVTGNTSINFAASFILPYSNMNFTMTGGVLNILSPSSAAGSGQNFSLIIGADPTNVKVIGGTVNITSPAGGNANITSTAPFWDLNLSGNGTVALANYAGQGSLPAVPGLTAQPLVVINNLDLLNSVTLLTNNIDVSVGNDFSMSATSTYIPGTNTTIFNGTDGQVFTNVGTITTGLNNLEIANTSNTSISQNLTVLNNLTIGSGCFLQDMGFTASVAGNITNSGTHTSQANGGIILNGTLAQSIGGSGNGIFGNLIINNSGGLTSLTANQSLTGNVRLVNGLLNIEIYNLSLSAGSNVYDALAGTTSVFSGTKMIRTAGNLSDGGLTKAFNSTTAFLFPVGTASDYTPATIQFTSNPASWGNVNIKPVVQHSGFVTTTNSLDYYWKVTQSGFSGVLPGSVSHTFHYIDADLAGRGIEANYIPGLYNPYSWTYLNDISQVIDATNEIRFNNVSDIEGIFTAGELDTFQNVTVYYSRKNGDWNDPNTWSTVAVGGAAAVSVPGINNPVVIGDTSGMQHTVMISSGIVIVGGLLINDGSVLDITTTTGHNFGSIPDSKLIGIGKLRISAAASTAIFPGGDFGNFLSNNGGTIEYYNTEAQDFTLPVEFAYYNNLILTPSAGRSITMPNIDFTVYGNLTISGTGSGVAQLNSIASRTLTIGNDLNIIGGTLRFMNVTNQTIYANRDCNISAGATFDVTNASAATNSLNITGNLVNNGTLLMYQSATRVCNIFFTGTEDKVLSGTGTNNLNVLNVNKGTSRNTILDLTANHLILNSPLALNNGTFRISNALLNFTLSTTAAFTIPISASLSVNEGIVNIGTTNNAGDLILAGRLEIINNGIVNIGNGGNFNNDIEYASGGNPEIIVRNSAILNVNGQIRRGLTITSGALSYTQTGGTVTISGRAQNTIRAKFELVNPGSAFTMSGGNLIIENGGGDANYFGDVILTPAVSNVSGGTIQLGNGALITSSSYLFNSSAPVWNLTIDGTAVNKTVDLRVNKLVVQNNLTINGNSVFRTNGFHVNIAGSLFNNNNNAAIGLTNGGYQVSSATQITTFDGSGVQTIQGAGTNLTNFANFVNATSDTLMLGANTEVRINGNLTLRSGSLNDGSNSITVTGNIDNTAAHMSPSASGGIIIAGAQKQVLSGNGFGNFGNLNLNNSSGIEMVDNSQINGELTFTNGSLYIDDYLLTIGAGASIAGSPDNSKMILTNGVISDQGVKKIFNPGVTSFTYPIGVSGKYTPVTYSFVANSNTNATIKLVPVNRAHPALFNAAGDELAFYYAILTSGFSDSYTVNQQYQYLNADVSGTELTYVTGRLTDTVWTPVGGIGGTVNVGSHQIQLSNVNYLDGEYTAGSPANFSNLPVLYSITSGNWSNGTTWSTSDHNGLACGCIPNGNPVRIAAVHTVTMVGNTSFASEVVVRGTLDLGQTVFHNLGHVSGDGLIKVTSTIEGIFVIPGGDFQEFMKTTGSTIEFFGNNNALLPPKPGNNYKPYQNVVFSGLGKKLICADEIKVSGNLTIKTGTTFSNELFNRDIAILGNWIDNNSSASGGFISGTGKVIFCGTVPQILTVSNGSTTGQFYNFEIDNPMGVTLAGGGQIALSNELYLTLGNITTNNTNLLSINNPSASITVGGGLISFVNGPLQKLINAGSSFDFPVGDASGNRYGNLFVSTISVTGNYLAQYYNHNPGNDAYNPANKVSPIDVVSDLEYWRLSGPATATANVQVRWDDESGIISSNSISRSKLRVVEWNGVAWQSRGNIVNDGGINSGSIQTNPAVAINASHYFTIGLESLPTAIITSANASICDDGSTANISMNLTGTPPWTIKYKVNGANETAISNIASTPFNLVVSNAMEPLTSGPGTYVFNVSNIDDATGAAGIKDYTKTVTITLNASPAPVISGNITAAINENNVIYTTPFVAGHTYLWSYSGPTGTTHNGVLTGNSLNMHWGGVTGAGWVKVQETVTLGGCSITTANYNVDISDTPNPLVTGPIAVCYGETVTYHTAKVGAHTYEWTLPLGGGLIVGSAILDSVVIQWTATGPYSVMVAELGSLPPAINNTLDITVNPVPLNNNIVTDTSTCSGVTTNITVQNAAAGISYQLRLNSDDSFVGSSVSSGPGGNVSLPLAPTATNSYNVLASNEYNCSIELLDLANVLVSPLPSIELGTDRVICADDSVIFDAGAGFTIYLWSSGETSQTIIKNSEDTYSVTVTGNNGCQNSDSAKLDIVTQGCGIIPDFVVNTPAVCLGSSVIFTNISTGTGSDTKYDWYFGDDAQPITANSAGPHQVVYATTGAKSVMLTLTDSVSKSITKNNSVLVNELPVVDLGPDVSFCEGMAHNFTLNEPFETYLWHDNSTQANYLADKTELVWVEVSNAFGCLASDTAMVTSFNTPNVDLGNDTSICGNSVLEIYAGEYVSYEWSTGEDVSTILAHPGDGNISVTVTDEHGCVGSSEIIIFDCFPESGGITNTFTPNGDNVHDTWVINEIELFPDAHIDVFDRWGRLVYSIDGGYENDWDGTSNGKKLPMDTYYYVIDFKVNDLNPLTGTVTIVR